MRISDASIYQRYLDDFQSLRVERELAIRQLADGKAVRYASDDPAGARIALEARARLVALDGFERSAGMARFDLETAEGVLSGAFDILEQARNKAMAGPSPGSDGEILANEVDRLRETLIGLANTAQGGRYLFGGTETLTAPFDPSGAYSGNASTVEVPIDSAETVGSTLSGQRVFLDGGDLFATLSDLSTALRNDDTAAINTLIPQLNQQMSHINEIRADVGGRLQRIDGTLERQADERLRLQEQVAGIENIELERAALNLTASSGSFQALSASAAQVLGQSLFDYLG